MKPTKLSTRFDKSTYHSFIQWGFMKTTRNLLEHHGIHTEILWVCINTKGTSRNFFHLWNEGEEIYNSRGTTGIEYSTLFSFSLIILNKPLTKGSFLKVMCILDTNTMHIVFTKFSKPKSLSMSPFDSNVLLCVFQTQISKFLAKN